MITAEQIRAGRALLRWTQDQLAEASGVSVPTLKRWEAGTGIPGGGAKKLTEVRRVMETAGVIFIDENGEGPGVRLRKG